MTWVRAFFAFWYDFLVGEDWSLAVGVVLAIAVADAFAHTGLAAWIWLPCATVLVLGLSVWRGRA